MFQTDYKLDAAGKPALDANGRLIPRVHDRATRGWQTWMPSRGAAIDITTTSLFVNDHWTAGAAADVRPRRALRARVAAGATGGIQSVDVQHVRASHGRRRSTLTGDGRTMLQAHLRPLRRQVQRRAVLAGHERRQRRPHHWQYTGPPGEGRAFAPAFDPGELHHDVSGTFPTANVFFADDLRRRPRGVHAGARRASSAAGLWAAGATCIAARRTSSRTSSRWRTAARRSAVTASTRHVRQQRVSQHRPRAARLSGG